jgi:hypothetical protein
LRLQRYATDLGFSRHDDINSDMTNPKDSPTATKSLQKREQSLMALGDRLAFLTIAPTAPLHLGHQVL